MENIFNKISELEQKKLLKMLETNIVVYEKNVKIPEQNNKDLIGIILKGYIKVTKEDYKGNRILIEELEENSIIGNVFYNSFNDDYILTTNEITKILYIDYDHIINYENFNSRYYVQFLKNLIVVSREINKNKEEKLEILSKRSIRDKLLSYFSLMSKKYGSKIIYLPFSYTDLADYLSVDRSALSRELNNLKNEGFIKTNGRKITLIML